MTRTIWWLILAMAGPCHAGLLSSSARAEDSSPSLLIEPARIDPTHGADTDPSVVEQPLNAVIERNRGKESPQGPVCGRYAENGCDRAGNPSCLSRFAACSVNPNYSVGIVGGGAHKFLGESRRIDEGTFGLDYSGRWFSRKVWMLWSHGAKFQGGAGAYATDGPKILPE